MTTRRAGDWGRFLEEQVLPRLFERLDLAFPEFGWERTAGGWVATVRETTKRVLDARPERVVCNRPFGFYAHGGGSRTWLAYVADDPAPRGVCFVEAVERLCELAGVAPPGEPISAEAQQALDQETARRAALAAVAQVTQRFLRGEGGAAARRYLAGRGLDEVASEALGLGFYPSTAAVREALAPELHAAAKAAGLFRAQLSGYAVFPWLDAWGRPLTLYFRWIGTTPPEGQAKTLALPGTGTKRSPLYFDRARATGERDLLLVEGVLDAAVLQARGETRTVACVAAQLSRAQVETLARHRVESVTICLDPDGAGARGTDSCLEALEAAGIAAYVAPTLPDGLDPDELVLRDGLAAWRDHVEQAVSSARYRAQEALSGVTRSSTDLAKDRAVRAVGELVASLTGRNAAQERGVLLKLTAKATGRGVAALRQDLGQTRPTNKQPNHPSRTPTRVPAVTDPECPYREDAGGLVWIKERTGRDGHPIYEDVPLANFSARITGEVAEDDGAEERRFFEVTAQVGGTTRVVEVQADKFGSMGWVLGSLGAGANLEPGRQVLDRTRHAIQTLSGQPPQQRVFTHLGWREIEGQWVYLHAGGAIGADSAPEAVRVRLSEPLDRFGLPEPPRGEELRAALQACLRFVNLAPKRLTIPLLALPFRAVQGEVDFTAFLYGCSGTHKSCLAALSQQFFGPALHYQNLPGSWLSSANALEGTLFLAKDALFVIDDFIPTGSQYDRARTHRDVDRVLRGQGNRAGRQRMRHDATLRPVKRSRALALCTGEELPRGESLTARMLVLPVAAGDVDPRSLSACQADADAGLYAQALSAFLRWLAPNYAQVKHGLRKGTEAVRAEFAQAGSHGRLAGVGANLYLGLRAFVRFVQESGVLTEAEAEQFLLEAKAALLEALGQQVQSQEEANPVRRFFELISGALASGKAHVASREGKVPENPQAWGWRLDDEGRPTIESWRPCGADTTPYWRASGERIGWVDGDNLYLEPNAAHVLVQRVAGEEGFPLSPRSLRQRLKEGSYLRKRSGTRETVCRRVTLAGARRSVLHVGSISLVGTRDKPGHVG